MSREQRQPSATYLVRARAFAEAVDIGISIYDACPPSDEDGLSNLPSSTYARQSLDLARQALHPEPPFANLKSLAYLQDAFFTFWNESRGAHVARFWHTLAERGLPFAREDVIGRVLQRGRIRTVLEYEHVTDTMGASTQGKLSTTDQQRLSDMLDAYEKKARGA
jgi:hypothetical protein